MNPMLSRVVLGLVVLVCAAAQVFLLRSILRTLTPGYEDDRRRNPRRGGFRWGPDRRVAPEPQGETGARVLEIAWVVIPAVGLAVLLYFAWLALPAR